MSKKDGNGLSLKLFPGNLVKQTDQWIKQTSNQRSIFGDQTSFSKYSTFKKLLLPQTVPAKLNGLSDGRFFFKIMNKPVGWKTKFEFVIRYINRKLALKLGCELRSHSVNPT